jgi:uncharacterized protein with HEPN domain/FMN phosphatase YigB (HAD superfamily)
MRRRDDLLLADIVAAANRIASYLDLQTKERFLADQMRQDALLMQLLVIGEAAARVPRPLRDRHPQVEWGAIAGFRNRAIHADAAVDWDLVWNAATVDVPLLAAQIAAILAEDYPATDQSETEAFPASSRTRLTFFLDVDNTLLDNDAAKEALARQLVALLGETAAIRFWETYEAVRRDEGMVDLPQTLVRFLGGVTDRDLRFRLADLVMGFPYQRFLFPGTLETIAHLQTLGKVAILSDGDPAFQPAKISRSGLGQAVAGYVLVYPHKEEHLPEITAAFAADHYVLVDDKPTVIERVAARLTLPLTTVFVRQGKYAEAVPHGTWPGAGLTIPRIGDLRRFDAAVFVAAGRGPRVDAPTHE